VFAEGLKANKVTLVIDKLTDRTVTNVDDHLVFAHM